jgi:hypothetical protein
MLAQLIGDGVAAPDVKTTAITSRKSCYPFARQPQSKMTFELLARKR